MSSKIKSFTAIDFEAATGKYNSICQIGIVRVENGVVVKEIDLLIQPPDNDYHWGNSRVHGIKKSMTKNAPTFDLVWEEIEPYVSNQLLVAHNAEFDIKCLQATLSLYQIKLPAFKHECTVKIFKKNLATLCKSYNIPLHHHNALSDAKACAALYMIYLNNPSQFS